MRGTLIVKGLLFTKSLNRKTCNFLTGKIPVYQWQSLFNFLLLFFFDPAPNLRSYYKAIVIKGTKERAHCIHCIKFICSIRVEYRCFVRFQVYLTFILQYFQVYSIKCTQKYCEWDNSLTFFVSKSKIL